MKKKLLLLFLFVFTSMILSGEIKKENIIGKKNRFFVSIAGETQDSALYVEFKDENKYTFFSPYGGYLWEISDYKIKGDTISLSVMKEEKPFNIEELNELFSSKNKNAYVDFVYDKDFCTFSFKGGYKNGNIGLFPKNANTTPEGTICMLGNVKVIKKSGYLVPVENLRVRKEPSIKAETGIIDYAYELMGLQDNNYRDSEMFNEDYEMFNKDYAKNMKNYYNGGWISSVLLAGMIQKYSAVTTEKQTIDGITAPWYRISFTDNDEGASRYYWIFGGYIKEISNPDTKEYEQLFFDAAVKKGYLESLVKIKAEKQKLVNQAKAVLEFAEPIYKQYEINTLENNDLLSSSKIKIGMKKQSVIDLWGQPVEITSDTLEYNTYEYTKGDGYIVTFIIKNNTVSKIEIDYYK